jgi:hypothetical protein
MKVAEIKLELSQRWLATDDMFEKEEFVRRLAQARLDKVPRSTDEERKRNAEERKRKAEEDRKTAEAARKKAAEEAQREEKRKRAAVEAEARKKAEEERKRNAEERKRKAEEDRKTAEAARKKAAEEAQREEKRKRAAVEDEARKKAEEERKRKAGESQLASAAEGAWWSVVEVGIVVILVIMNVFLHRTQVVRLSGFPWIIIPESVMKILKILRSMERVHFEIDLPKMKSKVVLSAVHANIKNVQHEYPKAVINVHIQHPPKGASAFFAKGGTPDSTCITGKLSVSCLKEERAGIERRIRECIIAAQPITTKINIDASQCKWLLEYKGANIQALTKQQREKYQLDKMFLKLAVTQDGLDTPGVLEVVTMHAVSSLVTSDATEAIQAQWSGASSIAPETHAPAGSFATGSTTASIPMSAESADEQTRVKLLSDPSAAAEQSIKNRYQHNGLVTTEGAMMLMARFITHQTTMFVYDGYIRDFVIYGSLESDGRGNVEGDLEVFIEQESLGSGLEKLSQFAKQHQIKLKRHQLKGPKVLEAFFAPTGGKEFPIELVDSTHFSRSDGQIDFDVNNLKLQPTTSGEPLIKIKFANQGGPVAQICHNARHRQLRVMKSPDQISDRIEKMKTRGWKLLFGESQ